MGFKMSSNESGSYDQLHQWLQAFQFSKGEVVIIDGESGSGKSSLAMRLAKDFRAARISLDCYVRSGISGYYVDLLEHEYLKEDIQRFGNFFPVLIIEGICVQDVLQRYGLTWSAAIYVKKVSSNEMWHFGLNLDDFISDRPQPVKIPEPFISDFKYHAKYKPHQKAGFIYIRISD
jgi:hypothetical protein